MSLEQAIQKFKDLFQETPTATFFAPGRVNLIGEHIDYNGGLVFLVLFLKVPTLL